MFTAVIAALAYVFAGTSPSANSDAAATSGAGTGAPGDPAGCRPGDRALTVAAAPEIAELVRASGAVAGSAGCGVSVTAMDPADFPASWATDGARRPDVWIPDSSIWLTAAGEAGVPVPTTAESVAWSPVVLAVAAQTAARLTAAGDPLDLGLILGTRSSDDPVRVGLPDPQRSATAIGAVLDVRSFLVGRPDERAALTWALRSAPIDHPVTGSELLAALATDPQLAVPVSEQALWANNTAPGATPAVGVYPGTAGSQLDFPYAVLASDAGAKAAASRLLATLQDEPARRLLLANGFRDAVGRAGPALAAVDGLDPDDRTPAAAPPPTVVESAVRAVQISNQPSRLLALLDISASMETVVAGTGGASRLDLAKVAAGRGLSLYPVDSELGLWTFSTHLSPGSDHRVLVPVGPLSPGDAAGQPPIAQALASTQVKPNGGTGLYDTVLEAVRSMRASWDPARANSVIVLSDGQNDDRDSITLARLLSTLRAEDDPDHPVPVIAIAFGPDSDVAAMTQISTATGGATYVALDPREIVEIFLDAVGQRLCRPEC